MWWAIHSLEQFSFSLFKLACSTAVVGHKTFTAEGCLWPGSPPGTRRVPLKLKLLLAIKSFIFFYAQHSPEWIQSSAIKFEGLCAHRLLDTGQNWAVDKKCHCKRPEILASGHASVTCAPLGWPSPWLKFNCWLAQPQTIHEKPECIWRSQRGNPDCTFLPALGGHLLTDCHCIKLVGWEGCGCAVPCRVSLALKWSGVIILSQSASGLLQCISLSSQYHGEQSAVIENKAPLPADGSARPKIHNEETGLPQQRFESTSMVE